jgi:hypothetical protein
MATGFEDLIPKKSTTTGFEDLIPQKKPAFLAEGTEDIPRMLPRQRATVAGAPRAPEPPKIAFGDVAKDEGLFKVAQDYLVASGQPGLRQDESREDLVKRFMSERRVAEVGTTIGQIPELMRIANAPEPQKVAIAKGRDLYEKMAGVFEQGGQEGLRPVADVAKGIAADIPLYLIGAGAGKVATQAAVRGVSKAASEAALKRAGTAGIAGSEALIAGAQDITKQRTEQEEAKAFGEEPEALDPVSTGAAMLFAGAVSAGIPMAVARMSPQQTQQSGQQLAAAISKERGKAAPATPTSPPTAVEQALIDPINQNMDKVHDEYMKLYGRNLLDMIDPANALTDAKVRTDMSKAAVRIALHVVKNDPNFQMKPQEQISSALNKVFARMQDIDDVVLEQALKDSGVSKDQFAAMNKATVTDAARVMQQYSAAARAFKRLAEANPEFDQKIKALYSFENDQVGALSKINVAQQRLANEWKAWITSGVDTTARNVLSTAIVIPLKTGVQLMEGTAYSIGSALSKSAKGQRVETLKRSMGDTVHDAFDVYFYLRKQGLSRDITEKVLNNNPVLLDNINNALQETGDRQVSAVARWANSLNVVVDSFTRRAVFTASVERQLRRQGKNLYTDFLDKDMDIPAPIIKEAMKDALQTTFAYMPRADDKAIASTFERGASTLGNTVIKAIDKTPFINFAIPFPRYMANAMAYLYRYSPIGMVGAGQETAQALQLAKAGKQEQAEMLFRKANEKWVQSAVGIAALASAVEYREQNKDVPWYEVKTDKGTTVDVRALGTPGTYFAIADIMVRQEQGTLRGKEVQDAVESAVGLKFKAGSGDSFLDRIVNVTQSDEAMRQFFIENGKFIGDIAGGFTQPFVIKQMYDFVNLVREEGRVVRDPNIIEAETAAGAFAEAAIQRVAGRVPVAKEQLPEAVIRLTDEELSREGEYFNRLLGFRQILQRSPVESEITRLNLDPYELYGSSSGDRNYDRDLINEANKRVKEAVTPLIQSPQYKVLPDVEKNLALNTAVRQQVSSARQVVNANLAMEDLSRVYKMRFGKLPKRVKTAINRRYAEDNDDVTLENAKDWFALDKYEAELNARTGTLTDQSQRLFGR